MSPPRTSVIVVSHGRPDHLMLCLLSLAQQDHPAFEIVVVADATGLEALSRWPWRDQVKTALQEAPNISQARNRGIALAAGDVLAFIDDDAVAEPSWLGALSSVFANPQVAAAGGYVRGPNGISFQSRGAIVEAAGRETPLGHSGTEPALLGSGPGRAIKTEGTNCAFRREILAGIGGFDPAFPYFLDETDVNMRLAERSLTTAIVPLAEVHHAIAPSGRRSAARLPLSLHRIGASSAIFLRKHAARADPAARLAELSAEHRRKLLRHMVRGTCEPRDVGRLLATLAAGWQDGMAHTVVPCTPITGDASPFVPFRPDPPFSGMTVIATRSWNRCRARRQAEQAVASGQRASLFLFSPTVLSHRVRFTPLGVWEQTGGIFGRAGYTRRLIGLRRFSTLVAAECGRVATQRGIH